jgi:hypothetical protein
MPRIPSARRRRMVWITTAVSIAVLAGVASIVQVETRVEGPCLLRPSVQWTLTELQPGSLESRAVDYMTGQTPHYRLYQFDRQAFVELELPRFRSEVDSRVPCESGQRVAVVRSTTVDLNMAERRTALEAARTRLATLRSGARPEELGRARTAVRLAQTALDAVRPGYERSRLLHETQNLSDQMWEQVESTMRLRELDLELASRELDILEAGSRPEEIAEAEALVQSLLTEVEAQETMLAAQEIVSPIEGWLRVGNELGPMVSVSSLDSMVAEIAIPQHLGTLPRPGLPVQVYVPGVERPRATGTVVRVDRRATQTLTGSFLIVYAVVDNADQRLDEGLQGEAVLLCGRRSLLKQIVGDVGHALRQGFVAS